MSSLFISYRRSDSPGSVSRLYDRLKARLPRWTLFYDHENLKPGEDFPERLRKEVTSAMVVSILIGPRWVESLKERLNQPGLDHVREEIRLALLAGHKVIPVFVENASMLKEEDFTDFPELLPLLRLNGRVIRPDPDFETDTERLAAFLDELGPGVGTGTILGGNFKILREIGQGGMGVVFEAEQVHPKRSVAVKMILDGMDTKEVLARFDGEKEALARMSHPNIARVIDSGSSPSGKPYFVMEFVKGEPITGYCDRKKMQPNDRLELFRLICSAVQHAHQKGIIHRDIKPSNVLVEEIDGKPVPKVIDFGLAKALAGKLTNKTLVSESGKTVGTLIYSSPEQAAGQTFDIDTRTDIYSLGVLLYELLAGEPPFTEEQLEGIGEEAMKREIIECEPSKPSTKLSSSNRLPTIAANRQLEPAKLTRLVRGELDWIVMRSLEKEPKRRYETANGLAMDIQRYLANEPVEARPPSTSYRLRKFVLRNRGPVLASFLVLLVLVGGVIGTTLGLLQATIEKERADQEANNAKAQEKAAKDREQDAKASLSKEQKALAELKAWHSQLARSFCDISDREFHRGYVVDSLSWMLRAYEVAPREDSLRASYRHLISAQAKAYERRFPHNHAVTTLAFSPDGRLALTGGGILSNEARLWEVKTGKPLGSLSHNGVTIVTFSPDGKLALTAGDSTNKSLGLGEAQLWDIATKKPFGEPLRHRGLIGAVAFSPSGRLVLIGSWDKEARLWEVHSGKQLAVLPHDHFVRAVAFSPDGRLVLTGSDDKTARLWEVNTGKRVATFPHKGAVRAVAFGPDGILALTGSHDHTARLWDVQTGKPFGEPLLHEDNVNAVAFRPSGEVVLTGSSDKTSRLWDIATCKNLATRVYRGEVNAVTFSPDGKLVLTGAGSIGGAGEAQLYNLSTGKLFVVQHEGPVHAIAFSPDGRQVLSGGGHLLQGGEARLWEVPENKVLLTLRHNRFVDAVAFSPDGRRALTGSWDMTARLWEIASGKELAVLPHKIKVHAVAISPDGTLALTGGGFSDEGPGEAWLWDLTNGKHLTDEPLRHKKVVNAVAFSPDGRLVLTGSDDETARVWEVTTAKEVFSLPHKGKVKAVAFSRDGKLILTGSSDKTARLWEMTTGKPVGESLLHEDAVNAVAFRPDNQLVLTGSSDRTARLWEVATGKEVARHSHKREVNAVAFSPDGRLVLIGGSSKLESLGGVREEAKLWEVATGKEIASFRDQSFLQGIAFSPDGRQALTVGSSDNMSGDGEARLWDVFVPLPPDDPVQMRAWVEVRTGKMFDDRGSLRDLSPDEWHKRRQMLDASGWAWQTPGEPPHWHLAQSADAEAQEDWFGARFHLDRLLKDEPGNLEFLLRRGKSNSHLRQWAQAIADFGKFLDRNPDNVPIMIERADARAELGEWNQAISDLIKALEREPTNHRALSNLALAHLGHGDLPAYHRVCLSMNEYLSPTDRPENLNILSWVCCLVPNKIEPGRLVRLMDKAVATAPKKYHYLSTRGVVLYRAGRFEDAIRQLNEAVELHTKGGSFQDWVFIAMGEFRLGHLVEARENFKQAIVLYDKKMKPKQSDSSAADWATRVEWTLLRKEAEQLLLEKKP